MDYDVAAIALATPPASAPVQSYRPAVAVKNLGIHDADVTGTLSIYDRAAGSLITTMNLAANNIAPGETRNAVANQLWEPTPADIGRAFLFTAVIVYPPDQNLTNNNLQPITVIVTAAPPTPPPPVEAHADQHEDGGGDQVNVEGLSGKLAEAQTPAEHASNHEDGGADQLDVAGLVGELATPQVPKTHATSHQVGGTDPVTGVEPGAHAPTHSPEGGDPIDVTGMPGLLADKQTPTVHGPSTHEFGQEDEFNLAGLSGQLATSQIPTNHGSGYHDATVEAVANKNAVYGYAGLDDIMRIAIRQAPLSTLQIEPLDDFTVTNTVVNSLATATIFSGTVLALADCKPLILANLDADLSIPASPSGISAFTAIEFRIIITTGVTVITSPPITAQLHGSNSIPLRSRFPVHLSFSHRGSSSGCTFIIQAKNVGSQAITITGGDVSIIGGTMAGL